MASLTNCALYFVQNAYHLLRNASGDCHYGCGHHANVVDLPDHEEACPLRSKCAINSCRWIGGLSKLVKHVEDDHPGSLVDTSAVGNSFTLEFEHPVLLLTQLDKISPNNDLYWIRLYKRENSQFVIVQYQGQIGEKIEKKFLLKEYSISPVNHPKASITAEVIFTKSAEEHILNDEFVETEGTDLTMFCVDKFSVKLRHVSSLNTELLAESLQCFICAEIMLAPIRMCLTGHSLCDACTGMVNNKCPMCQKKINRLVRNYALEELTENLLSGTRIIHIRNEISCWYKESGCQFVSEDGVDSHVKVCEYQLVKCTHQIDKSHKCVWEGPHKKLNQHIDISHRNCVRNTKRTYALYCSSECNCSFYSYDNNYFMCRVDADTIGLKRYYKIFFSHLTTQTESNYNFKMKLNCSKSGFLKIFEKPKIFTGPCSPHKEVLENVGTEAILSIYNSLEVNIFHKDSTPRLRIYCINHGLTIICLLSVLFAAFAYIVFHPLSPLMDNYIVETLVVVLLFLLFFLVNH